MRSLVALLIGLVTFAQAQTPFIVPPKRWAMVIGVNGYPHFGNLSFAENDAKSFKDFLQTDLGYDATNISLLTDAPDSPQKPTAENVTKELDRLLADPKLNKSDLFIFYFAGHGVGTPKADYLLPADTTKETVEQAGLPVKQIVKRLVDAKLRNVLFIADACRTGAENSFGKELIELTSETNICLVLGTQPNNRSYEYPQLKHGVFTYQLLKALKDPANKDKETGALWASKVATETSDLVKEYTKRDYPAKPQTPSAWVATRKDVLLRLDPKDVIPAALQKDIAKLATDEKERYALYLLSFAEVLVTEGSLNQALQTLQALDAINPDDDRILHLMNQCAMHLGRTGFADRLRTKLLSKPKPWSWYSQSAAVDDGSFPVSDEDFAKAFEIVWPLKHWDGRYYMVGIQVGKRVRRKIDFDNYLATLLADAKGDPRHVASVKALLANYRRDYKAEAEQYAIAVKARGDEPPQEILVTLGYNAFLSIGDMKGADNFVVTAPGDSQKLLLERATAYWRMGEKAKLKETLDQYFASGLKADDLLRVMSICGTNREAWEVLKKAVLGLQEADWRIKLAKLVLNFNSSRAAQDQAEFQQALTEFKEEYPMRLSTMMEMMMLSANGVPDLERFPVYNSVFFVGTASAAKMDDWPSFWDQFRDASESSSHQFFFSRIAIPLLVDRYDLAGFDTLSLLNLHRILLQCGYEESAAKIARALERQDGKVLALENRILELIAQSRDAEGEKLLAEAKTLDNPYKDSVLMSMAGVLEEFYRAKREHREMNLDSLPKSGLNLMFQAITRFEAPGHQWSDQDVETVYTMTDAPGYRSLQGRLFAHVDFAKLSPPARAKIVGMMIDACQLGPGIAAYDQIVIRPGSKLADFAMKVTAEAPFRINTLVTNSKVVLEVDKEGKVTGSVQFGPDKPAPIEGTVDANGNLRADIKHPIGNLHVTAKLWPIADPDCLASGSAKKICLSIFTDQADYGWVYCPIDPSK